MPIAPGDGPPMFTAYLRDITQRKLDAATAEERTRLATLGVDVGIALVRADSLKDMLQCCCEAMVRHLNGAFARIWTLGRIAGHAGAPGQRGHVHTPRRAALADPRRRLQDRPDRQGAAAPSHQRRGWRSARGRSGMGPARGDRRVRRLPAHRRRSAGRGHGDVRAAPAHRCRLAGDGHRRQRYRAEY